MKNWRMKLASCLTVVLMLGALNPLMATEIDLTPRVVQGEMIYEEGFPSGESFFIFTRPQAEEVAWQLSNAVSKTVYNDLGESYNTALKVIQDQEIELTQETQKKKVWRGIAVGTLSIASGIAIGAVIWGK